MFGNLLNNASKYTEPGGHIWLTAERQGSDVVVSVRDTGIGIPPDKLPRVFEMFTQVDRSLERSQGGLGIGLTLVKRLVEMHGGTVEARSDGPGRGSEFVVRLPVLIGSRRMLSHCQSRQPSRLRRRPAASWSWTTTGTRPTALPHAAAAHGQRHADRPRRPGGGGSGGGVPPDVMLLDIGLPKLNGYEACRRIREQPWGKDMVLIALTGWGQEEDRRRSQEAGFDHHMVKPVDSCRPYEIAGVPLTATSVRPQKRAPRPLPLELNDEWSSRDPIAVG